MWIVFLKHVGTIELNHVFIRKTFVRFTGLCLRMYIFTDIIEDKIQTYLRIMKIFRLLS